MPGVRKLIQCGIERPESLEPSPVDMALSVTDVNVARA